MVQRQAQHQLGGVVVELGSLLGVAPGRSEAKRSFATWGVESGHVFWSPQLLLGLYPFLKGELVALPGVV